MTPEERLAHLKKAHSALVEVLPERKPKVEPKKKMKLGPRPTDPDPDTFYQRPVYSRPKTEPGVVLPNVEHGTTQAYNKGCKCLECRAVHAAYRRASAYRKKARDAAAAQADQGKML